MAVINKLGIWGGDPGATWSSASGGIISGFNANTLNYATKMNQAFRNATIIPYTFAQILAEASIPSVNIDIDPSTFIMNSSAISAFVTSMRSAINYYICSRAGQIASAGYAFNAGSATTANAFSTARYITLTGDITGSVDSDGTNGWTINTTISDGSVTSTKLGQSAVTSAKISAGAVTAIKIASYCITSNQIAQGAIVNTNLANPSVTFKNGTNGASKIVRLGSSATQLSDVFGFNNTTGLVQFNSNTKAFEVVPNVYETTMTVIPNGYLSKSPFVSTLLNSKYPNVSYIGISAFENCSNLFSINLPNVTYINNNAFSYCARLTSITLPNVTYIGSNAFDQIGFASDTSESMVYISVPNLKSFGSNWINPSHSMSAIGGKLMNINLSLTTSFTETGLYSSSQMFKENTIKDCYINNLEVIPDYMFANQSYLDVLISNYTSLGLYARELVNCKHVGYGAFAACGISDIHLKNCSNIGEKAFLGCSNLTGVYLGSNISTIRSSTFALCSNLVNLFLERNGVISLLGGSTTLIGCDNLTNIYVPSNQLNGYQNNTSWVAALNALGKSATSVFKPYNF